MTTTATKSNTKSLSFNDFKNEVLNDYKVARISRECSLLGRREVLTGKASLVFLVMEKKFLNWQWLKPLKMVIFAQVIIEIKLL